MGRGSRRGLRTNDSLTALYQQHHKPQPYLNRSHRRKRGKRCQLRTHDSEETKDSSATGTQLTPGGAVWRSSETETTQENERIGKRITPSRSMVITAGQREPECRPED
jgi:hypothetical protein